MEKKQLLPKCWLRTLAAYSAVSFLWIAFHAMGTNEVTGRGISEFADILLKNNLAIAGYALIYGFSVLIIHGKKLSTPAKYSLHILVNYVASMVCVYLLFSNNSGADARGWMAVILLATVVFFLIYGLSAAIIRFVKKRLA